MITKSLIIAFSLLFFSIANSETESLGDFKNPEAVKEVLLGQRKIANAAWWGFDKADSTLALQSAINSGAKIVIVPFMGSDWIVRPIKLENNQAIHFDPGVVVVAKKGEFKGKKDCLFSAINKNNIIFRGYGATLKMQKNTYRKTGYVKSEWRHILSLAHCEKVSVFGLTFADSGGDGLYIGESSLGRPCKDILVKDCLFENNHRQGVSVISVHGLNIENCTFQNTSGTNPSAGVDLEPNNESNKLINVVISDCLSKNNSGPGFQVYLRKLSKKSSAISILFENCHVYKSGAVGLLVSHIKDNGPMGLIEFRNCIIEETEASGIYVYDKSADRASLIFRNCKLRHASKRRNYSPISLSLKTPDDISHFGGIEFIDCDIYDQFSRPTVQLSGLLTTKGIKGNLNVYAEKPVEIDRHKTKTLPDLKITKFKH